MVPRKNHTTIGIPRQVNPQGSFNTLCRIRTTDSYLTGKPVTRFEIELSAQDYLPRRERLNDLLKALKVTVEVLGLDSVIFHENGKESEEVVVLSFAESGMDSGRVKADLERLAAFFEAIFDESVGSSLEYVERRN